MARIDRRRFVLALTASAASASLPRLVGAAMGPNDKFDLVIKGGEVLDPSQRLRGERDIGIRYRRGRGGRGRHPRRARAAGAQRRGQARHARPHRPARARLSLRLGDRHPRRRARAVPGHHDAGVGGRRRRQQLRRLPPLHRRRRRAPASTPSSTSPTSGSPASRSPELYNIDYAQHRGRGAQRWRRTPTSCSASRCACRRTSSRSMGSSR